MAEFNSTQMDQSRFALRSYGWRKVDVGTDRAIYLLERAFQSARAIEGIASQLRAGMGDGDMDVATLNANEIDKLLTAIDQLSSGLSNDICAYAGSIDEKIEALDGRARAA